MELWALFAILAAFMQNIRAITQKKLSVNLDTLSATYARFLFAFPLSALFLIYLLDKTAISLPTINLVFLVYAIIGGTCQIAATILLVYLYNLRNFAVGGAFKKTEALQAAVIGFIVIGDLVSVTGFIALGLGFLGLLLLTRLSFSHRVLDFTAFIGLLCGTIFAVSAVFYRASILSLDNSDFFLKATTTLTFVLFFQSLTMGVFLEIRRPGTFFSLLKFWPYVLIASFTGAMASLFWFSAFSLQNAAYVKAVGQVELLFSLFASIIIFKERVSVREILGILFVGLSILILAI